MVLLLGEEGGGFVMEGDGSGVFVLLNQSADRGTAVEEEAVGSVSLTVYNTVGQVVRRMDLGVLSAGTHQAVWDVRTILHQRHQAHPREQDRSR